MERTGGRALQHQRQALPVLESDSPPTAKQGQYAKDIGNLIPLILEVKAGALPSSISQRSGVSSSFAKAFNRNGTLTAGPHAQSIHNKLNAIRETHPDLVKEFEATLKNPSSRLPPLEQAASDLRDLIPLILEVKDGPATPTGISRRQGTSSAFANAFKPDGTLKPAVADNKNAQAIHNKLDSIRQAHPEVVLAFEAATNMPRSNSSRASTSADPIQTLLSDCLMKASTEFAKARSNMADIALAVGVSEEALRPFFTDSGPTEQGLALLGQWSTSIQEEVMENVRIGEERSLKPVLDLLQSGHTFEEIGSLVEGVTVPDFFGPGSVTARGRDFLLSLDEDQRSTYARVLNLPVDWASPVPQASAQSPLPIHIPGEERSSGGIIPSTLQHQRQALPVLESDSPPTKKQVQDATYIGELIPLILEVKDHQATPRAISGRPEVSSSFAVSFNREGTLKQASANRNAGAIRNKLKSIRQSHRALFRQFSATTNMPRTSKNSPASTDAGLKQTLVSGGLMRASTEFAKASSSMADMARAAGLSEEAFHPFFTEFGP
ncbi:MAG: hypothetical protein JF606_00665, partial [Burkholderiales bacterium]|nr:hypothetical protein [Burkholderiales bacterium]